MAERINYPDGTYEEFEGDLIRGNGIIGAHITDGVCDNVAVFADTNAAAEFGYIICPKGYGIGDSYDGETWTKAPAPEPSVDRRAEIIARLSAIDSEEIRPLAAIANETATTADTDKLAALETEKAALRAELAELNAAESEG